MPFSVFLVSIAALNLFSGMVICSGETVVRRFLCAFYKWRLPQERDLITVLEYTGINSSVLLMTAMPVDRLIAVAFPHYYLSKVKTCRLWLSNTIICVYSLIFASINSSPWDFNGCLSFSRRSLSHNVASCNMWKCISFLRKELMKT